MSVLEIPCKRTTLCILSPRQAGLVERYYLENREHLQPWEPSKEERFYSLEQHHSRLRLFRREFKAGQSCHFAVLDNRSGCMIGMCNFSNIVRGVFQACHLGYAIAASHQGGGYMYEAVQAGIGYMFDTMQLHRIMANYMPRNERSARLLERLGFEKEGRAKSYLFINGKWEDHILTSLVNPKQS